MALDDDFAGGFSNYYNPSFGLMAIQQPDMFVQHLARNGVQPPPDFEEGFTHQDAHSLLRGKDQSRAPGMGESPAVAGGRPQQGSFDERFSDAQGGAPGTALPYTDSGLFAPRPPQKSPNDIPSITPPSWDTPQTDFAGNPVKPPPGKGRPSYDDIPMGKVPTPEARSPGPKAVYDEPGPVSGRPKFGQFLNPIRPGVGFPSSIPGASEGAKAEPLKKPDEKPTPAAAIPATVSGATTPAGDTSEHPGGLDKEDPNAKTTSEKEKKGDKAGAWDGFGKALAGISAMKPPQIQFPHPGNIPHPSNQISRSTLPTELMKELSSIGHPGQLLRLGAALKGR